MGCMKVAFGIIIFNLNLVQILGNNVRNMTSGNRLTSYKNNANFLVTHDKCLGLISL